MAFPDPEPGVTYTSPIDWHPDPIEIVHGMSSAFSGASLDDCYHPSSTLAGIRRPTPVIYQGSHHGDVRLSRAPGGTYPQDEGGLDCAWHWVREGYSDLIGTLWPGFCPTPTGTPNSGSVTGAGWSAASTPGPNPVFASSTRAAVHLAGYTLRPSDIFHAWTGPLLDTTAGDIDAAIAADFDAAFAAHQPTPGSFLEWEYQYPEFVGYQVAPDEQIPVGSYAPDGTVYWTVNATGWAMFLPDPDVEVVDFVGPGELDAILLTDYLSSDGAAYDGGVSNWLDPDPDWIPVWDPEAGVFETTPIIPFNLYHEFHAKIIPSGDPTIPPRVVLNTESTLPDGFGLDLGAARDVSLLAVKALWKPPRFRFGTEGSDPVRKIHRRDDQAWASASRPARTGVPPERIVGYDR